MDSRGDTDFPNSRNKRWLHTSKIDHMVQRARGVNSLVFQLPNKRIRALRKDKATSNLKQLVPVFSKPIIKVSPNREFKCGAIPHLPDAFSLFIADHIHKPKLYIKGRCAKPSVFPKPNLISSFYFPSISKFEGLMMDCSSFQNPEL